MGNEKSNLQGHQLTNFFRPEDWIRLSFHKNYQIWKHKYTHEVAEVYRLINIPDQKDIQIYEFRSKHQEIIKVFFIGNKEGDLFCGKSRQILLLVEHIPLRLEDVEELTQAEGLTILVAALKGYRSIQNEYGTVWPRPDLIGFNTQGKTKVWLSKHPQHNVRDQEQSNFYFDTSLAQSRRLKHLYDIIERKTSGYLLPYEWKLNLLDKNADYQKILTLVEKYAKTNKISLREYIRRDSLGNMNQSKISYTQQLQNSHTQIIHEKTLIKVSSSDQLRKKSHNLDYYKQKKIMFKTEYVPPIQQSSKIMKQGFEIKQTHMYFPITISVKPQVNFVRPRGQNVSIIPQKIQKTDNQQQQKKKTTLTPELEYDLQNKRKPTIIDNIQLECSSGHQDFHHTNNQKDIKPATIYEQNSQEQKNVQKQAKFETVEVKKQISKYPRTGLKADILQLQVQKIDGQEEKAVSKKKKHSMIIKKIVSTQAIQQAIDTEKQQKVDILQSKTNPISQQVEDYLDINFMEKSLSKKFCTATPAEVITPKAIQNEDDIFNIARLQEGLVKFEQSQQSQRRMRQSQTSGQDDSIMIKSNRQEFKQEQEGPSKTKIAVNPFTISEAIVEENPYLFMEKSIESRRLNGTSTEIFLGQKLQKPRATTNYYMSSSHRKKFKSRDHNYSNVDKTYDSFGKYTKDKEIDEKYERLVKNKQKQGNFLSSNNLKNKKGSQVSQDSSKKKVTYDELISIIRIDL